MCRRNTVHAGRLFFHINAAYAEFQRSLAGERTKGGIATRKGAGAKWGAKPKLTPAQIDKAIEALRLHLRDPKKGRSVLQLSKQFRVDPVTLRKAVQAKAGEKLWVPGPNAQPHERAAARRKGLLKPKKR